MTWQLLRLQITPDRAEEIELLLLDHGALSVTLDDAEDQQLFQLEPGATPLWNMVRISGMFDSKADLEQLVAKLRKQAPFDNDSAIEIETLADQEWEKSWMDRFQPMQFGNRLWICPSWTTPPQPEAVTIMLDPGLAFGTGTHPTTALCLEWLEQQDLSGKLVIDYGCGSGVLAIAAALLGAEKVLAVDNDPQAIVATQANRSSNRLDEKKLSVFLPEDFPPHPSPLPADILVANILAGPLQDLAPSLASLVGPAGQLALSGILPEQAGDLLGCYQRWFQMSEPVERDGWTRLCGTRRYS